SKFYMDADTNGVVSRACGVVTAQPLGLKLPFRSRLRRFRFRKGAKCFVLSGGSLLPNLEGVESLSNDEHWFTAGRFMIALGLSVGPFESVEHEDSIVKLLRRMKYVAFRDSQSYEWACKKGLTANSCRAFDLAVLFGNASEPEFRDRQLDSVIGVSLLAWQAQLDSKDLHKDLAFARELGQRLRVVVGSTGQRVVFLSLCLSSYSDDRLVGDAFAEGFGRRVERFAHNGDAKRTFERIRQLSQFVSMRLHGSILAYTAGVPFLSLEYHPKCKDFAVTIGLDERHRVRVDDIQVDEILLKVAPLLEQREVCSDVSLARAQTWAKKNFDHLFLD
ncbi:polysaccharide pyruvyl transferase family protein, partial [Akkermansiaceae bacterium]|nr:polysaccharide pyruvyl transferase family protein [Akkermansiaceae bacterium]